MFAPIFKTLDTSAVRALAGAPARIYSSADAPQNVQTPYITWFVVTADPYNQISGVPDGDSDTVQIDCWAGPNDDQELVCVQLAQAVRSALDAAGQANRVIVNNREKSTGLYRIALQAEFIHSR